MKNTYTKNIEREVGFAKVAGRIAKKAAKSSYRTLTDLVTIPIIGNMPLDKIRAYYGENPSEELLQLENSYAELCDLSSKGDYSYYKDRIDQACEKWVEKMSEECPRTYKCVNRVDTYSGINALASPFIGFGGGLYLGIKLQSSEIDPGELALYGGLIGLMNSGFSLYKLFRDQNKGSISYDIANTFYQAGKKTKDYFKNLYTKTEEEIVDEKVEALNEMNNGIHDELSKTLREVDRGYEILGKENPDRSIYDELREIERRNAEDYQASAPLESPKITNHNGHKTRRKIKPKVSDNSTFFDLDKAVEEACEHDRQLSLKKDHQERKYEPFNLDKEIEKEYKEERKLRVK
mgnify:CR=1 FL=1